jgi:predicted glycosyltransferase
MFRINDTDEIINKALKLLVAPKKHIQINHDNLFKLIVDNVYDLAK